MNSSESPLEGEALIKEVCRHIRVARSYWETHNNAACRRERERALVAYFHIRSESQGIAAPHGLHLQVVYAEVPMTQLRPRVDDKKRPQPHAKPNTDQIESISRRCY